MKCNISEDWLEDALEFLFDLFSEEELKELDVIEIDELMATTAAVHYSETIYPLVMRNFTEIPVNVVATTKTKKSVLSKNKVSAYKGSPILYVSKTKNEDKDFGISVYMELWLLEDGKLPAFNLKQKDM